MQNFENFATLEGKDLSVFRALIDNINHDANKAVLTFLLTEYPAIAGTFKRLESRGINLSTAEKIGILLYQVKSDVYNLRVSMAALKRVRKEKEIFQQMRLL